MYITTPQGFWYAIIINAHTQMPFSIYNMHKAGGESRARERSYKGGGGRGGESIQLVGNMRERWREKQVTWYERFCHGHPINIYIHKREREREGERESQIRVQHTNGRGWGLVTSFVCVSASLGERFISSRPCAYKERSMMPGGRFIVFLFILSLLGLDHVQILLLFLVDDGEIQ